MLAFSTEQVPQLWLIWATVCTDNWKRTKDSVLRSLPNALNSFLQLQRSPLTHSRPAVLTLAAARVSVWLTGADIWLWDNCKQTHTCTKADTLKCLTSFSFIHLFTVLKGKNSTHIYSFNTFGLFTYSARDYTRRWIVVLAMYSERVRSSVKCSATRSCKVPAQIETQILHAEMPHCSILSNLPTPVASGERWGFVSLYGLWMWWLKCQADLH